MEHTVLVPDLVHEEIEVQLGLPKDSAGEWTVTFTCRRTCLFTSQPKENDGSESLQPDAAGKE